MRIVEGISERVEGRGFSEDELGSLQSILLKLLSHCKDLGDDLFMVHVFSCYLILVSTEVFSSHGDPRYPSSKFISLYILQNHYLELVDMMYGSSRSAVNLHILNTATRYN